MIQTVFLDIDGTLIDSNDAHAASWVEALQEQGIQVEFQVIRRRIGMGGDHLLPQVAGFSEDTSVGQAVSQRRGEIFRSKYLPHLKAFPKSRELIQAFLEDGLELIVTTSATEKDLHALLQQAHLQDLLDNFTSGDDAEKSKPSPDIIHAALEKTRSDVSQILMLGDTPYDIEAAKKAHIQTVAFTCGGWSSEFLNEALEIYEGPWDLLENISQSPFSRQIPLFLSF